MHVLRSEFVAPGAELADGYRPGSAFSGGLFRMVKSRETSDDPPRRLSVQQDVGRAEGATDRGSRMRAGRSVVGSVVSLSCCSTPSGAGP
jgi:hypothetical protein